MPTSGDVLKLRRMVQLVSQSTNTTLTVLIPISSVHCTVCGTAGGFIIVATVDPQIQCRKCGLTVGLLLDMSGGIILTVPRSDLYHTEISKGTSHLRPGVLAG